jgi:glutamate--cysteine ligase
MLDVPMYFVYRDGTYIDAAGQSFRDFLAGKLPALPGARPTLKDWEDHLTTAFPEVRLKRYLEMRGADGGPWSRLCALPALWAGLLYHPASLDAAWDIARDWTLEERIRLRADVPRLGLNATVRGRSVREIACELIELAAAGLAARDRPNAAGDDETGFLLPLREVAETGVTPAERKLALFHGPWKGSVDPAFTECAY